MPGLLDPIRRYGEPALNVITATAAQPVAGWAGLLGGDVQKTLNALTFQPHTEAGQQGQNSLARVLREAKFALVDNNPPVRMAVDGFNSLANQAGSIHPAFGAAVQTIPTAAGLLAGPGSQVSRNALADAVRGTGRSLAPKAGQMAESYMRKTGGLLDVLPPEVYKQLIDKQRSGAKLSVTERVMLQNHQSDLMGDLSEAIQSPPVKPVPRQGQ